MRHKATLFHAANAPTRRKNIQCIVIGSASDWFCEEMGLDFEKSTSSATTPTIFNYEVTGIDDANTTARTMSTRLNPDADFTWFALLPRNAEESKKLHSLLNKQIHTTYSSARQNRIGFTRQNGIGFIGYNTMEQAPSGGWRHAAALDIDFNSTRRSTMTIEPGRELTREQMKDFTAYFKKSLSEEIEAVTEEMQDEQAIQGCCITM